MTPQDLNTGITLEVCEAGHVHFWLVDKDSAETVVEGIFTPKEAYDLATLLMKAAAEADTKARAVAGPCTLQ